MDKLAFDVGLQEDTTGDYFMKKVWILIFMALLRFTNLYFGEKSSFLFTVGRVDILMGYLTVWILGQCWLTLKERGWSQNDHFLFHFWRFYMRFIHGSHNIGYYCVHCEKENELISAQIYMWVLIFSYHTPSLKMCYGAKMALQYYIYILSYFQFIWYFQLYHTFLFYLSGLLVCSRMIKILFSIKSKLGL